MCRLAVSFLFDAMCGLGLFQRLWALLSLAFSTIRKATASNVASSKERYCWPHSRAQRDNFSQVVYAEKFLNGTLA